jgi:hypothetical protein
MLHGVTPDDSLLALCDRCSLWYEEARIFLVLASAPGVTRCRALFRAGRSAYYEHLCLLEPSYPQ